MDGAATLLGEQPSDLKRRYQVWAQELKFEPVAASSWNLQKGKENLDQPVHIIKTFWKSQED